MVKNIQQVSVQHRNKVLLPATFGDGQNEVERIAAFAGNLNALGYRMSEPLLAATQKFGVDEFNTWAKEVLDAIRSLKGASFDYKPMYPNFPKQVAEASDVELFVNSLIHYFGDVVGLRFMPSYVVEDREPLAVEDENLVELGVILNSEKDTVLGELFSALISSKVTLSVALKKDVKVIAAELDAVPVVEDVSVKENLAFYVDFLRKDVSVLQGMLNSLNNPTDVLRIAAVFGGSDASLMEGVVFGKLNRAERRAFVSTLNRFPEESLVSAFKRHSTLWKKFMKHVHVGEFAGKFPVVTAVVDKLRNGKLVDEFNSAVEQAVRFKDFDEVVRLLSGRPSVFVRRLYELLTVFPDRVGELLTALRVVAAGASSQVLVQAYGRFTSDVESRRLVFSRSVTKAPVVVKEAVLVPEVAAAEAADVLRAALVENFSAKGSLGKVYLPSGDGASHAVPFGLRSGSDAFKLLGRGSQLPFDMDSTLRFFLHWKDIPSDGFGHGSRVDVDLSAALLDTNFNIVDRISYYNLKGFGGVHSGDITSAPQGAAEFIDLVPSKVVKVRKDARYIAMSVIVYTGQRFDQLPEALAGFMVRSGDAQKGEIFDARTVENVFKVSSSSRHAVPFLFDLVEGKAIWLDLATSVESACQNVDNTSKGTTNLLKAFAAKNFVSVETLFTLHAEGRATEIVGSAEEADTVLDYDAFTFDEILSEWI